MIRSFVCDQWHLITNKECDDDTREYSFCVLYMVLSNLGHLLTGHLLTRTIAHSGNCSPGYLLTRTLAHPELCSPGYLLT